MYRIFSKSVIILLLIGVVLRISVGIWFPIWSGDTIRYDKLAWNLAQGNGYSACNEPPYIKDSYRPPLYPLFLASIYRIFGHNQLPVRIIQGLVDTLSCFIFYLIARRVFGYRIGLISLLLVVFFPFTIYYVGAVQTETVFTLLMATIILIALIAFESNDWKWPLLVGLIIGITTLCRTTTLALPVFLFISFFVTHDNKRTAVMKTAYVIIGTILAISPWTIRNYQAFGKFVPVAPGIGQALWIGSHDYYMKKPYQSMENDYFRNPIYYSHYKSMDGLKTIELDKKLFNRGIEKIRSVPVAYAIKTLKAIPRLWISSFHPELPGWLLTIIKYSCYLVLSLGISGILVSWRSWKVGMPLLIIVVYFSLMYAPLINHARYTVPIRPILLIYIAVIIARILEFAGVLEAET